MTAAIAKYQQRHMGLEGCCARCAAAQLHALAGESHPVTTHWSNTFQRVHPPIAGQTGIDLLCMDVHLSRNPDRRDQSESQPDADTAAN